MTVPEIAEVNESFGHDGPSNDNVLTVPTSTTQTVNKNSSQFLPPIHK